MKEILEIRNFGTIKSVRLELGRFNILIGEQATGKSTVAKILAVCRYFSYVVGDDINSPESFNQGLYAWGLQEAVQKESFIYYKCKDYALTVKNKTSEIRNLLNNEIINSSSFQADARPLSNEFINLLNELNNIKAKSDFLNWRVPTSFFLNDVKNVMDNPFYLPTERGLQSIFSLGQSSIPNLANFLFKYYSKVDGIFQSFKTETEIEPLNIIYINKNGIGYIRKKNEKEFYLLANAASGYQSTIPIVLVIKYYELQRRRKTFLIEEPELNLFPIAQNNLMQYLVDKTLGVGNSILLTTHSPYILTSLNNMIYAYWVGLVHPKEINGIIEEKYWLNPDDVSAYRLLADGTLKNILDVELKQINVGELDEISQSINTIWDKIASIEFNQHYEG